jgi:hypothetical protein
MAVVEQAVAAICALLNTMPNVRWHHCTDARRCTGAKGMPDLVIVITDTTGSRVLWREVKPDFYTLRPDQVGWKYALMAAGMDWGVWTPRDLASGQIAAELSYRG